MSVEISRAGCLPAICDRIHQDTGEDGAERNVTVMLTASLTYKYINNCASDRQ